MKKLSVLLFVLLFVFSCDDESIIEQPNSDELFTVSGKVTIDNVPVESSTITLNKIDSETNYSTETNAEGDFSLEVLEGSYTVVVSKTFTDGSFLYYSYQATVNQDVNMENIEMPEPVTLSSPTSAPAEGFTLNWSESTSNEFAEYRLYTNDTATIDETTGTLIYTGTSITDTSFFVSENLVPQQTYYYKVFVVDTTGEIAGSNVIEVTIEEAADPLFSVSGNVLVGSSLTEEVQVQFDRVTDNISYSATTNTSGEFQINDVEGGDYTLTLRKDFSNGSYVINTSERTITQDIIYDALILNEPVDLLSPSFVSSSMIQLNWTQSTANDFQEYRIYMGSTPNVDETTGTLIQTETSISNTEFNVTDVTEGVSYFFRIYVANATSITSASNILEVIPQNTNLVFNGGFEDPITNPPSGWAFQPAIGAIATGDGVSVVNNESYTGNQSLRITPNNNAGNSTNLVETVVVHAIPSNFLEPNATYRISFYMKYNITNTMFPNAFYLRFFGSDYTDATSVGGFKSLAPFNENNTWIYYEHEITLSSTITAESCVINLEMTSFVERLGFDFWIDDVQMIRIN